MPPGRCCPDPREEGDEAWTAYEAGLPAVSDQELIVYADEREAIAVTK